MNNDEEDNVFIPLQDICVGRDNQCANNTSYGTNYLEADANCTYNQEESIPSNNIMDSHDVNDAPLHLYQQ